MKPQWLRLQQDSASSKYIYYSITSMSRMQYCTLILGLGDSNLNF